MKPLVFVALTVFAVSAFADDLVSIKDGPKIQAILASISTVSRETGRMTLAERLASLGVGVEHVTYGKLAPDEIDGSQGLYKKGDTLYQFSTTEVPSTVLARCKVWAHFSIIKRGKTWLPESRTANYYMFNSCNW